MKKLMLLLLPFTPFVLNAQCGDTTPPTGTAPADVSVQCIGDVPAPDPLLITDEADNVTPNPTVTHISDVSDGSTCPETITRTYRIEDDCNNFIDVTQIITVDDITNPTGSAPADTAVYYIGDVPAIDVNAITDEADNCTASPIVTHISDVSDGLSCPETITRTYGIADDCGNSIFVNQTITVNGVNASVSISTNGDTLTANLAGATYQWLDCDNNMTAVTGANTQWYSPPVAGNFAVYVNDFGCADTSDCYTTSSLSVSELQNEFFSVYPQPAADFITVEFTGEDERILTLLDISGKVIRSVKTGNLVETLDVSGVEAGTYILNIRSDKGSVSKRLMIE
ncbi:MAG: T9SS type A sorting domain-containing protein [Crocinitomicaceae bacterium]